MSIVDGSPVNAANVNSNLMSKNVDNTAAGKQTFSNTTQSTDKDTGAVILEGGLGVEKNINAGGNISAVGTMSASNLSGTNTGDQTLSSITGTLAETKGGTNQTTYSTGDILFASAANTLSKRSIGTTNQVLTVIGGVPTWQTPSASVAALAVTTKAANYTASTSDDVILCNTSGGGFAITLPTAVGNSGKAFYVKKISSVNNVTVATTSSQTIDGSLTQIITGSGFTSVTMVSDGSNWFIL